MLQEHCPSHCSGSPGCFCEGERYIWLLSLAAITAFFQFLFSRYASSAALFGDAMHTGIDAVGYLFAFVTEKVVRGRDDGKRRLVRSKFGVANFLVIFSGVVLVYLETWEKFRHLDEVILGHLVLGASLGLAGNFCMLWISSRSSEQNQTRFYINIEIWSDFLGSLAILAVGIPIIYLWRWYAVDAILSFLIGTGMLLRASYIFIKYTLPVFRALKIEQ